MSHSIKMILFRICNITSLNLTNSTDSLNSRIQSQIIYSIIIGCVALICGYIRTACFNLLADRQIRIIRKTLFQSILKKDIDFFDRHKTGELGICLTDDVNKIYNGIGVKLSMTIEIASTFIGCLGIGKFIFVKALIESESVI
jgi:ABC-type multidrug transport system fused ATPase/permease subunit